MLCFILLTGSCAGISPLHALAEQQPPAGSSPGHASPRWRGPAWDPDPGDAAGAGGANPRRAGAGGAGVRSPGGAPLAKRGAWGRPWAATGGRAPGCPRGGVDGRWQCCTGAGPASPAARPRQRRWGARGPLRLLIPSNKDPWAAPFPPSQRPPGIAPRLPLGQERQRSPRQHSRRDGGPGASPGTPWVLRPPSPCSEDAGSIERVGRVVCMAALVPSELQEQEVALRSPVTPVERDVAGRRGPERGAGAFGNRSTRPKAPPGGESPILAPLPGQGLRVPPALPAQEQGGRNGLRGTFRKERACRQERFLSQGFSFFKSSFEGGEFGGEES